MSLPTTCERQFGAALPLVLLTLGLGQASLLLGWRYLNTELALIPRAQEGAEFRRHVLACAMQPDVDWELIAQHSGDTSLPDTEFTLRRRVWQRATSAAGDILYMAQCTGTFAGQSYTARTGWRRNNAGSYILTLVVPDADDD